MSTFKEQPVYAEIPFALLDVAMTPTSLFSTSDVTYWVAWNFHGGTMGNYPMSIPTDSSKTRFPHGTLVKNARETLTPELRDVLINRRMFRPVNARTRREITSIAWLARDSFLKTGVASQTGLCAVYAAMRMLFGMFSKSTRSSGWRDMSEYIVESMATSANASRMHADTVSESTRSLLSALSSACFPSLEGIRKYVLKILEQATSGSARARSRRFCHSGTKSMDDLDDKICYIRMNDAYATMRVTYNAASFMHLGRPYILSRSDIKRLYQMIRSVTSAIYATVAQATFAPHPNRKRTHEVAMDYIGALSEMIIATSFFPPQEEVFLCKVMKRALGVYYAELAGPLCVNELRELIDEMKETPYYAHSYVESFLAHIRKWDLPTALNFGKIYKVLPAPDACIGRTLMDRHKTVCNSNAMDPTAEALFRTEHRNQMLRAAIRTPGLVMALRDPNRIPTWISSYRKGNYTDVPSDQINEFLAWEGTAAMPIRSKVNPKCWKDSGLGWDNLQLAFDPDRPRNYNNMLLRMLFDPECPMPGTRHMTEFHVHLIDQKPEAHKADGSDEDSGAARGIYSSNLMDRLNQSWMEVAVHSVTRNHPAFMIGANIAQREARSLSILSKNFNMDTIDIYYSFDIKGWSPLMPSKVQHISHENWAELFDEELFRVAKGITDDSVVYANKQGYKAWYVNPGTNFEGYNAREMTFILITMMSLAVREWRVKAAELIGARAAAQLSAVLLGYIDDGLAKATVTREHAERLFSLWKTVTKSVFARCGFTLEVSKCYPSDRFAIFLNEVYYMGRHIPHGTRAAMTMSSENITERLTFLEKITAVTTGARGAVVAGLDAPAAASLMYYHLWDFVKEYVGKAEPFTAAIWTHAPRAWGGLGVQSILSLATSGGGAATEEAAYVIRESAKTKPAYMNLYRTVVRTGYGTRSAAGTLTAPLGGAVRSGVIPSDPVSGLVREAMEVKAESGELSPLATSFLLLGDDLNFRAQASDILGTTRIVHEQVLRDAYTALPQSIFSAFCKRIEKSSTLRRIVGAKKVSAMQKKDREDVKYSYTQMEMKCY